MMLGEEQAASKIFPCPQCPKCNKEKKKIYIMQLTFVY